MGPLRVFLISAILTIAAIFYGLLPSSLPHPACRSTVHEIKTLEDPGSLTGNYTPNTALQSAVRLFKGKINGSESIAISPSGTRLFMADKFGGIYTADIFRGSQGLKFVLETQKPIVKLKGRALGIYAMEGDSIIVCDAVDGLLDIDLKKKTVEAFTIHKASPERKIIFANDLDVAPDGSVLFTDTASIPVEKTKEGYYSIFRTFELNLAEGKPSGRLLSYDVGSRVTRELMGELWYANGVAVSEDGTFVAVVETNAFRVHRYWLQGPKTGTSDLLIEHLPGFPDGISRAPDGNFWIALVAPPILGWRLIKFKAVRLIYAWLTEYIPVPFPVWGYVVKVSPDGKVLQVVSDIEGGFIRTISSAVEHNGHLIMGHVNEDYVSVLDLGLLKERNEQEEEVDMEL